MSAAELPLFFLAGLDESEFDKTLKLAEGSVNFYPTKSGEYLQNYPGKTKIFRSDGADDEPATGAFIAEEPSTSMAYTKIISFIDYLGIEHIVFSADNQLYTVEGNGARLLHTFTGLGRGGTADSRKFPYLFIHEQKLIILNHGDPPLVWDGIVGVVPVGVRETPNPPRLYLATIFVPKYHGEPEVGTHTFFHTPWEWSGAAAPDDARRWYLDAEWPNGLANDSGGGGDISGIHVWRVQFVDHFGNKGKASAASRIFVVPNQNEYKKKEDAEAGVVAASWAKGWPVVQWNVPSSDQHISAVYAARSLSMHPSSATVGSEDSCFVEWTQANSTGTRYTAWRDDAVIATGSLMDLTVGPPPSSEMGCSWGGRLWFVSLNRNRVYYSDAGFFGQFRDLQSINPYSNVSALIPAGDRLFVIGESSTEVYFLSADSEGVEVVSLLEQDTKNGSRFGNSFVDIGDGAVFGLWSDGFGYYDGVKHVKVSEPYWLKDIYMDNIDRQVSSALVGDWYYLSIRKDYQSLENNVIVMFNTKTNFWYLIKETVRDICEYKGEILGVYDSVYILFRGGTYAESRVRTVGLAPDQPNLSRTVSGLKFLMEPSSFSNIDLIVEGEEKFNKAVGTGTAYPLKNAISRTTKQKPYQYWGHPDYIFGSLIDPKVTDWQPDWMAPGDFWMVPQLEKNITGYSHTVDATFSAGFPIKIKALALTYSKQPSAIKGQ